MKCITLIALWSLKQGVQKNLSVTFMLQIGLAVCYSFSQGPPLPLLQNVTGKHNLPIKTLRVKFHLGKRLHSYVVPVCWNVILYLQYCHCSSTSTTSTTLRDYITSYFLKVKANYFFGYEKMEFLQIQLHTYVTGPAKTGHVGT